jgi:hypothetical protein
LKTDKNVPLSFLYHLSSIVGLTEGPSNSEDQPTNLIHLHNHQQEIKSKCGRTDKPKALQSDTNKRNNKSEGPGDSLKRDYNGQEDKLTEATP